MSTSIRRIFLLCVVLEFMGQAQYAPAQQLVDSIVSTLRAQQKSGGIVEVAGCSPAMAEDSQKSDSGSVNSRFDHLAKTNAIKWSETGGVYFIWIPSRAAAPLMNLRLSAIVVPDGNLDVASGLIMQNDIFQRELDKSHIRFIDRSLGFSPLPSERSSSGKTVTIPAGTVAEDLNWLASRYPSTVWLFRQTSCEGKQVVSLSWLSR